MTRVPIQWPNFRGILWRIPRSGTSWRVDTMLPDYHGLCIWNVSPEVAQLVEEKKIRVRSGCQEFKLMTLAFFFGKLQSTDIKISSLLIKSFHRTGVRNVNEHHGTLVAALMTEWRSPTAWAYWPLGISELAGGANWQKSLWKWLSFSNSLCYFN